MAKAKKNQDDSVGVDTLSEEDETDATEAETDATEEDAEDTDTDVDGDSDDVDSDSDGDESPAAVSASAPAFVRGKGPRGESTDGDSDSDSRRGSSPSGGRPQPVLTSSGGSDDDGSGDSGGGGGGVGIGEREVRRAHLTLSRVEPWSVMKFSFVISLVCFIILFVAVAVVYVILSALGVFDAITELIASLTDGGEEDDLGLNPESWFSAARVLGYTGLWGAANIVLITALSTFGSMLYNLAADLVGGLDITLSESE